jgi:squalene-hopene/tetraprenyl-beta-curcumene cyclase
MLDNLARKIGDEPVAEDRAVSLDAVIHDAAAALLARQAQDGHWVFELEADATIPAEYIFLNHYLDTIDDPLEARLGAYLRKIQGKHGGWPLFHDGDFDISASVKAYYALKLIGDDIDAPHMVRAREAILAAGGAARANVFTRYALALFEQVPWRAVPVMPVEVVLLPKWFPFHMDKVSYWSRTVMIPLLVLASLKPKAVNPRRIGVPELFRVPADLEQHYHHNPSGSRLGNLLLKLDSVLQVVEPYFPKGLRRKAVRWSEQWVTERLNGEDGLGAIFPAMANSLMMYRALGYPADHELCKIARKSIDLLVVDHGEDPEKGWAYVQPCVSPIWDTGLAAHALMEAGIAPEHPGMKKAGEWLRERQVLDVVGDWAAQRPNLRPGGWAFQYRNDYYPDVDDTAVVAMALDRAADPVSREALDRAVEWIVGMQSSNGGWAAFDAENEHYHLNHIPFADHGALLDPPTLDVSARCLSYLAQIGYDRDHPVMQRGLDYMRREQEADGSWFGRWGTNYIYGTWSALCAFNVAGEAPDAPHIRKAVDWLKARQRPDGGWGEDCASYWEERKDECKASTPSQTAWALLGLMAAGEVDSPAVKRGIDYLLACPRDGAKWNEELFTSIGFPRVFYLRYHGYSAYFPLWALARYRNLTQGNDKTTLYGM